MEKTMIIYEKENGDNGIDYYPTMEEAEKAVAEMRAKGIDASVMIPVEMPKKKRKRKDDSD